MICPHCRKETEGEAPLPNGCGCLAILLLLWLLWEGAIKIFIARIVTGHWNG